MHNAELHLVLPALRKAIAAETGLASPDAPSPTSKSALWTNAAVEAACEPTWSVLMPFSPVASDSGPQHAAIQVYTQGRSAANVLARLAEIHDVLLDHFEVNDSEPKRNWQIGESPNEWLVDIFELEEGKLIGNLDEARVDGSLNFVLAYRRI